MGFDLNTAKPVAAAAPPARGGFDLASARPVDPGAQVPGGGLAGNRNVGKPTPDDGPRDNLLGVLVSPVDAALSAGSSMLGRVVGNVAGVGKSIIDGKYGTVQGANEAEDYANQLAGKLTRQPSTNAGRKILEGLATVSEPLAALPSAQLAELGAAAKSSGSAIRGLAIPSAAVQDAADAATLAKGQPGTLRQLVAKPAPPLSGVGAARATDEAQRAARFQQFGITPTKGQLTRDRDQLAFESDTAKLPEGKPLQQRADQQNAQVSQVFDNWYDQTGAQNYGIRAAGKSADTAINNKHADMKKQVTAAYDAADAAGETAQQVPYKKLSEYLDDHSAEIDTNNVPMLAAVRAKLAKLDPDGTGMVTVKQMEEIRKMAGRLTQDGTPNAAHIGDVKGVIDAATEGAGGDLYREARRLNTLKENQFGDNKTIAKLISDKPGYTDRAVPMADVVDHLLFDGGTEDVLHVRRVLQAGGGDEGAQAWKDLQGAAVNKMRDQVFPAGGQTNGASETVARAKRFSEKVDEWHNEGRLQAIFGDEGAAKVLDFNDALKDLFPPPGVGNPAGTAAAIQRAFAMGAFNKAAAVAQGVPGLSTAAKFIDKKVQSAVLKKRVDAAVNPDKGN